MKTSEMDSMGIEQEAILLQKPLLSINRIQWLKTKPMKKKILISAIWHRLLSSNETEDKDEEIEHTPFYGKYAKKIKEFKTLNAEEYYKRLDNVQKLKRQNCDSHKKDDFISASSPSSSNDSLGLLSRKQNRDQKLHDVMRVELLKDMNAEDIGEVWSEYHRKLDCLYSVIKEKDFDVMEESSKKYPMFIYPLPRQDGYEFFLSQFSGSFCYFTPLHAYQKLRENTMPLLKLAHFTELKAEKGIVLMRGHYDKQLLDMVDAVSLARQMSLYYSSKDGHLYELLRLFNTQPQLFNYSDVITQFQSFRSFVQPTDMSGQG